MGSQSKVKEKRILMSDYIQDKEVYFYRKDKGRRIIPSSDEHVNEKAKKKLKDIYQRYKTKIPRKYIENWERVKLFDPSGDVDRAHSLILNLEEGSYDLSNSLNHLTGKEWTIFSCSWFIFNALQKDLKEEREISKSTQDHPATYSATMMENFIKFFTKEGMSVLDPFMGIGSTMVGCKRSFRIGYGVELNSKYFNSALKRAPEFENNMVCDDSRKIKKYFGNKKFDFSISSPPYWNVLNRSTRAFEKNRSVKGLDSKYSNNDKDLGNISDYEKFIDTVTQIYIDIYDLLRDSAYLVVIVKNVKKEGKFYPLAWDIARVLSHTYSLKDEKIWIQDKISLAPYGYPYSWAANILHHYCLVFKKEVNRVK